MITVEFITALFSEVDEQMRTIPKHPEAHLWPSEVVTLGLLHALKVADARLSALVSPPPRAHPALSALQDASRLDADLPGCSDRARRH